MSCACVTDGYNDCSSCATSCGGWCSGSTTAYTGCRSGSVSGPNNSTGCGTWYYYSNQCPPAAPGTPQISSTSTSTTYNYVRLYLSSSSSQITDFEVQCVGTYSCYNALVKYSTGSSYVDIYGLTRYTQYQFQLRAKNSYGTSAWSASSPLVQFSGRADPCNGYSMNTCVNSVSGCGYCSSSFQCMTDGGLYSYAPSSTYGYCPAYWSPSQYSINGK